VLKLDDDKKELLSANNATDLLRLATLLLLETQPNVEIAKRTLNDPDSLHNYL
jgi:hypothetical protein